MQIGQTPDLITNADMSKFSDRVDIKEGINTHRVLNGPYLTRSVYWPTLLNDQGQVTQRMRSVIVPKTGSDLLRSLADAEKEFRRNMGETDPRSQFTPSNLYLYLIFNRDEITPEDELPTVRVAGYKQTVYNRLTEIQSEVSTKDKTKLKNGLIFMYDVQIKKTIGDKARARYTTKYTVDVDSENNKVMGVIPVELLDMSGDKVKKILDENKIWKEIFTKAELEAINECKTDLGAETSPNSEEQILSKLRENPIFLGAKDANTGQFLFPQNEKFIQFIKNKELPILESAAQLTDGQKTTPANVDTTSQPPAQEKEVVVETSKEPIPAAVEQATEVQPEGSDNRPPIIRWGEEG